MKSSILLIKKKSLAINLLFFLIIINSSAFFLTEDKKAGLVYLREFYLITITTIAIFLIFTWKAVQKSKTGLWIIFFGLFIPMLSAALAKLNFNQPFTYGLLEERRSFSYLVFFPLLFLLIKAAPTQKQLERFFIYSGLICAATGYLYYFKIIPENTNITFAVDTKEYEELLRPNRYRIGAEYISLCAFILMYNIKDKFSTLKFILLLVFSSYLWLVLQTRQTMLIWLVCSLWIFRDRLRSSLKLISAVIGTITITYLLFPEIYYDQYLKLNALLYEATSQPGVRSTTISIILKAVSENGYIGMGALSLQWNGGFSKIYNDHFYLSDVGIFGIYYRFGFLSLAALLIYYIGLFKIIKKCRQREDLLKAFSLYFLLTFFNMILSNAIVYGGSLLGIATACFLYYAKIQITSSRQALSSHKSLI